MSDKPVVSMAGRENLRAALRKFTVRELKEFVERLDKARWTAASDDKERLSRILERLEIARQVLRQKGNTDGSARRSTPQKRKKVIRKRVWPISSDAAMS